MITSELLLRKFPNILDSKGRINGNLKRMRNYHEIQAFVDELIEDSVIRESFDTGQKILFVLLQPDLTKCKCEVCGKPTKYRKGLNDFTPFCSFKCSRQSGTSTFTKAQQTCIERYGVKSNLVTKENQDRIRANNGGIGTGSAKIANKIRQTCIEKYGVDNVFKVDAVKQKIADTHNNRYGANFHTAKIGKKIELLEDEKYCREMASQFSLGTIASMIGVTTNTIYKYFDKHSITTFNSTRSFAEVEILGYLRTILPDDFISISNRKEIGPFEIDLFIPRLRLGIEHDGAYWHSELKGAKRSYHKDKLELANSKNINLIQIFENEWLFKKDIVKSRISSLCGVNDRIFARKCKIKEVPNLDKKLFLEENHLQGDCASSTNLGLFDAADKLVGLMTFGKSRFDKNADFELLRFCCTNYTNIVGGFSKLLSEFKRRNRGKILITFADRRYSRGEVYSKNGFKFVSNTNPSYYYFKKSTCHLENRIKFQKHKLHKILENFNSELSEWDNMKMNGYNRIWDCGNSKWICEM